MSQFEIKFIDCEDSRDWAQVESCEKENTILLTATMSGIENYICFDKSTAIKFAKTLRTEINKIQ